MSSTKGSSAQLSAPTLVTEQFRLKRPSEESTGFAFEPASKFLLPLKQFIEENSARSYPAIVVPKLLTHTALKRLKPVIFDRPRTLNVYSDNECEESRKVLLSGLDALEHPVLKEFLSSHRSDKVSVSSHTVYTSYEHYSVEKILHMLLPSDIKEIPSAFEVAGHLAHVNLREECLPYRRIIGQVILDKNQPRLRTVVNKVGSIENEFRTFPMEVIAGENDMEVEVKETGCRFRLNFSKVYWNSRLQYGKFNAFCTLVAVHCLQII